MARYFVEISYDGTNFHGWQIQPNAHTVQEEVESQLKILLKEEVPTMGCGRTDTGVHAKQFFLHFDFEKELPISPSELKYKLNQMTDVGIAVHQIFQVPDDMHSRFSAISRSYKYFIHFEKSPFKKLSWEVKQSMDLELMRECGKLLLDIKDFTSFAKLHTDNKTNDCDLMDFNLTQEENGMVITITANRFLRIMVRAIVGTLVEVGIGKLSKDDFVQILAAKNRGAAGASAPAKGLFLWQVKYPSWDNE